MFFLSSAVSTDLCICGCPCLEPGWTPLYPLPLGSHRGNNISFSRLIRFHEGSCLIFSSFFTHSYLIFHTFIHFIHWIMLDYGLGFCGRFMILYVEIFACNGCTLYIVHCTMLTQIITRWTPGLGYIYALTKVLFLQIQNYSWAKC